MAVETFIRKVLICIRISTSINAGEFGRAATHNPLVECSSHSRPTIYMQMARSSLKLRAIFIEACEMAYFEASLMHVPTIVPSTAETTNQVVRKIAMMIYGYGCLPVISQCASVAFERSVFDAHLKQIVLHFTAV